MKVKELVCDVENEIREEKQEEIKKLIKESLLELQEAKKLVNRLQSQFNAICEIEVDDFEL